MSDDIEMLREYITNASASIHWMNEALAALERLQDKIDKYVWQVRDTCTRAVKAETERDALLAKLDEAEKHAVHAERSK